MGDVKKISKGKTATLEQNVDTVPKSKKELLAWIKAHQNQLILAGISITAIIGIAVGLKNRKAIVELWAVLENSLKKATKNLHKTSSATQAIPPVVEKPTMVKSHTPPQEAVEVRQHIRNLSGGRHHSMEKAAEAAAMGIELLPNQTLVDPYTKYAA